MYIPTCLFDQAPRGRALDLLVRLPLGRELHLILKTLTQRVKAKHVRSCNMWDSRTPVAPAATVQLRRTYVGLPSANGGLHVCTHHRVPQNMPILTLGPRTAAAVGILHSLSPNTMLLPPS